jgi:hypothetical protein
MGKADHVLGTMVVFFVLLGLVAAVMLYGVFTEPRR